MVIDPTYTPTTEIAMMVRNMACAGLVLAVSIGFVSADPIKGRITAVDGNKISFMTAPAKKGEKGESKTFDAAANVKVLKSAGKDKTEPLAGGLKAAELQNIDAKKGVGAVLEVTGSTVSEITISGGKKK